MEANIWIVKVDQSKKIKLKSRNGWLNNLFWFKIQLRVSVKEITIKAIQWEVLRLKNGFSRWKISKEVPTKFFKNYKYKERATLDLRTQEGIDELDVKCGIHIWNDSSSPTCLVVFCIKQKKNISFYTQSISFLIQMDVHHPFPNLIKPKSSLEGSFIERTELKKSESLRKIVCLILFTCILCFPQLIGFERPVRNLCY